MYSYSVKFVFYLLAFLKFTDPSSAFEPHALKFPKHNRRDGDDAFKSLADTYYQRGKQVRKEISAPYKQPSYPIEQLEDNQYFERQLSSRYFCVSKNLSL